MKRVSVIAVIFLAALGLLADKYYQDDSPDADDGEVYFAQNFEYINPHLRMDGSWPYELNFQKGPRALEE